MSGVPDAARAERHLRLLAEAGVVLLGALDQDTIVAALARMAVPEVADACLVDVLDAQGEVRRGGGLAAPGLPSTVTAPMLARGRTLGTITFGRGGARSSFDEADLALVGALAQRAALALDNARLLQEARHASRLEDQRLAQLSHDLRAPLNAIVGWAHVLGTGGEDRAVRERAVAAISRNAALQTRLIEDVLGSSRPEPEPEPEAARASSPPLGSEARPATADPSRALAGVHVLVVDDEKETRDVLSEVIQQHGGRVSTAGSVPEAVARLAAEIPDVVLGDIGMPEEDGYSLMRRIRAMPAERGGAVPAVALTAYARAEDRMQALLAGYQVHVPKPVQPAELIRVVAALASRRSARRPSGGS
jgi:CheY-like chemotaxis protein